MLLCWLDALGMMPGCIDPSSRNHSHIARVSVTALMGVLTSGIFQIFPDMFHSGYIPNYLLAFTSANNTKLRVRVFTSLRTLSNFFTKKDRKMGR